MTVILSAKQILYLVAIPGTKHPLYLEAQNLIGTPGHIQVLDKKGEAKKKSNDLTRASGLTLINATLKTSEAEV
jgi:hypothetical protein